MSLTYIRCLEDIKSPKYTHHVPIMTLTYYTHHAKCLLLGVGLQPSPTTQIILLSFQCRHDLSHVRVGVPVHCPPVYVVPAQDYNYKYIHSKAVVSTTFNYSKVYVVPARYYNYLQIHTQ